MNRLPPIILYDGVCGLCNKSVQFVLRYDRTKRFRFATLQSNYAQNLIHHNNQMDSFVLVYKRKVYTKSTGALKVLQILGFPWTLGYGFILIPPSWRDAVYDFVARKRYQWFGKYDTCVIPDPSVRELFLDEITHVPS